MEDWHSKKVLIIGAARQGIALARFLAAHGASVVLTDLRRSVELELPIKDLAELNIDLALGDHPKHLLEGCDLVCPSGGVPLNIPILKEARSRKIPFSNDSQIFLDSAPCKIIGVTGSAGKTTVTTLLGRMADEYFGKDRTWVGGNIGSPLISYVDDMREDHIAVMELSSFQLEIMEKSPHVAGVLNLTPNHLDRHITMAAYRRAKLNILRNQSSDDYAILGVEEPGTRDLLDQVQGHHYSFGSDWNPQRLPGVYLHNDMISFWDGINLLEIFHLEAVSLRPTAEALRTEWTE